MKRSKEEIQKQIDGLKRDKEKLPEYSKFGDPNWQMIDAQLSILEGREDIDDFEEDEDLLNDGLPDEIYNAAQAASDWLDGLTDDNLFDE